MTPHPPPSFENDLPSLLETRDVLAALGLLREYLPADPERSRPDPVLAKAAPALPGLVAEVLADPELGSTFHEFAAEMAWRLSATLHRSGAYAQALDLADHAAAASGRALGIGHRWTLRLGLRATRSRQRLGHLERAVREGRHLLKECEEHLGYDDLDTLESCVGLGVPLGLLGEHDEAQELFGRALSGRREHLGPDDPATLHTRNHQLAFVGDDHLPDAVEESSRLLDACRTALGPDHTVALAAQLTRAELLHRASDAGQARVAALEALHAHIRVIGTLHPVSCSARHLYALTCAQAGDLPNAVTEMQQTVDLRSTVLGPIHPFTRSSAAQLATYQGTLA